MKKHIFIFKTHNKTNGKQLKINEDGDKFFIEYEGLKACIDFDVIENDTSTSVIYNRYSNTLYPLYNFREILQAFGATASEFCKVTALQSIMQIDKSHGDVFIKIFLPEGADEVISDTTDFSRYEYSSLENMNMLDLNFSWQIRNTAVKVEDGILKISCDLYRTKFWKEAIYLSHAGQSRKLKKGHNEIEFKYVPQNEVFAGKKNCRYLGRQIDIELS